MGKLKKIIILSLCLSFLASGQSQFNKQSFSNFLQQTQNLSTNTFYQMYNAGTFSAKINRNIDNALYLDTVSLKYSLTLGEKSLLKTNGFMVSQRLNQLSFGIALYNVYQNDLPVFISTDAILHAYHCSYDLILKDFELGFIVNQLSDVLNKMSGQLPSLAGKYSENTAMATMLHDVDVYLSVPEKLLSSSASPVFSEDQTLVTTLIQDINAYKPLSLPLFSTACKNIDFSQFEPRGHYTDEQFPQLKDYFKAMMWLGRIEIYLMAPRTSGSNCAAQSRDDLQRQATDAFLINELIDLANVRAEIGQIENVLKFFIGEQDNVTCDNLVYLQNNVPVSRASDLLDSNKYQIFVDSLKAQSFASQKILSQILFNYTFSPDSVIPASAFLLFGQRFTVDAYVTSSVVYDRIRYQGNLITRMLPSSLDILFALGNDAAGQLLKSEIDAYHYGSNLSALRYLVNSYDDNFWQSSLYNSWLSAIRTLNPPAVRDSLPGFMQTAAYWQEKMITQLASWAQLKHDNLLYAKQSYTAAVPVCSYPYAYLEPFPSLYHDLQNAATTATEYFQNYAFTNSTMKDNILAYYSKLANTSSQLEQIAKAELKGTPLQSSDMTFLQGVLYEHPNGCSISMNGWYPDLFYRGSNGEASKLLSAEYVVADYHTAPTDESGNPVGWIKHAGIGPVELGVFVVPIAGVGDVACSGPVFSFEEYTTTNFKRLTDEEWATTYMSEAMRPSFVNLYLADSSGTSRGEGLKLLTGIEKQNSGITKDYKLSLNNYPNPFNSTTIIQFTIPASAAGQDVELAIYDINGRLVDRIQQHNVPAGSFLMRWSPTEKLGKEPSSGIYICTVRAGAQQAQHKIVYLK